MKTSDNGINLIASFEGCKLTAYKDAVGVWTIGYGHTSGVKSGQTITQNQAIEFLKSDVAIFENAVNSAITNKVIKFTVNQNQFDALVSFAFNLGGGRIKTLCENRSAEEVANAILLYNKAGGKVLAGLTKRRQKEKELFETPVAGEKKEVKKEETKKEAKTTKTTKKTTTTKVQKNPYSKPTGTKIIQKGTTGEAVKWVQWQLANVFKYSITVDGIFGAKSRDAVMKFQKSKGISVDGKVGKQTIKALSN